MRERKQRGTESEGCEGDGSEDCLGAHGAWLLVGGCDPGCPARAHPVNVTGTLAGVGGIFKSRYRGDIRGRTSTYLWPFDIISPMGRPLVVRIPGLAYTLASNGTTGRLAGKTIKEARVIRRGVGRQAILSMTPRQANDLLDYFESRTGAAKDMADRGHKAGSSSHYAVRRAIYCIEAAQSQARGR